MALCIGEHGKARWRRAGGVPSVRGEEDDITGGISNDELLGAVGGLSLRNDEWPVLQCLANRRQVGDLDRQER